MKMKYAILCYVLIILLSSFVFASDDIITDLERNKDIFREPHFTNCQDQFFDDGHEKEMFFVLTLENVDDYILDDNLLTDWNVYADKLARRHYDEEGKYKGICVTIIPKGLPDDYDGPIQKLTDYQNAKDESLDIPTQVIKIQNDNDALDDCREQRDRYENERDECDDELQKIQSNATILQNNLHECNERFDKLSFDYSNLNSTCVILPDGIEPVKTYYYEYIITIVMFTATVLFALALIIYMFKRFEKSEIIAKKQAVEDYKHGRWNAGADEVRKNSKKKPNVTANKNTKR